MIKILAGKVPFEQYKNEYQLMRAFDVGNAKLSRPNTRPSMSYANEIWSLAEKCLNYDPKKHPTADEALEFILDLNMKDRSPQAIEPPDLKTSIKRPKIDYDMLISIIERVRMSLTR